MDTLIKFDTFGTNDGHKLRLFVRDGAVWIIAVDAARELGIEIPSNAYRRLGADERTTLRRAEAGLSAGGDMVAISESGFYKLVLRSDKPAARAFQEWVTREVLPAIRRTGGYRLAGVAPEAMEEGTVDTIPDVGGVMRQLVANNTQATELITSNITSKGIVHLEGLIFI